MFNCSIGRGGGGVSGIFSAGPSSGLRSFTLEKSKFLSKIGGGGGPRTPLNLPQDLESQASSVEFCGTFYHDKHPGRKCSADCA